MVLSVVGVMLFGAGFLLLAIALNKMHYPAERVNERKINFVDRGVEHLTVGVTHDSFQQVVDWYEERGFHGDPIYLRLDSCITIWLTICVQRFVTIDAWSRPEEVHYYSSNTVWIKLQE